MMESIFDNTKTKLYQKYVNSKRDCNEIVDAITEIRRMQKEIINKIFRVSELASSLGLEASDMRALAISSGDILNKAFSCVKPNLACLYYEAMARIEEVDMKREPEVMEGDNEDIVR